MSYQGLVFAITVGVAIGAAIYAYFATPEPLQHGPTSNNTRDCDYTLQPRSQPAPNRSRWVCEWKKMDRKLRPVFFRNRRKDEACSICLRTYSRGDSSKTRTFTCGHTFHIYCITSWLHTGHSTCPNCRKDLQ